MKINHSVKKQFFTKCGAMLKKRLFGKNSVYLTSKMSNFKINNFKNTELISKLARSR